MQRNAVITFALGLIVGMLLGWILTFYFIGRVVRRILGGKNAIPIRDSADRGNAVVRLRGDSAPATAEAEPVPAGRSNRAFICLGTLTRH